MTTPTGVKAQELANLTKENFWNELYVKYPDKVQEFCDWIDEYKKRVHWDMLFFNNRKASPQSKCRSNPVKYHDLPLAMQLGIFIQFRAEVMTLNNNWMIDDLRQYKDVREYITECFDNY